MLRLLIENTLDREEKTMAEWQTVRLGEIVKTNQSTYSPKENWQFVNYLDTGNITMNKIDEIQNINTAKDKLPSRARRKVNYPVTIGEYATTANFKREDEEHKKITDLSDQEFMDFQKDFRNSFFTAAIALSISSAVKRSESPIFSITCFVFPLSMKSAPMMTSIAAKMASGIRMTLFRISLYPLIIFPNGILSCFYPLSTEKMLFFNCRLRETASRSYAAMPQVCGSCVNIIIILFIFPWMLS